MKTNTEDNITEDNIKDSQKKVKEQKPKKLRFRRTKRLNPVTTDFIRSHKENISLIRSLCNFGKKPKSDNIDSATKTIQALSESQKQQRMESAKKIIQLGIIIPVALFIYTMYLLIHLNFVSFLIAFILTINASLYILSEALTLHQLKNNLTSCSFSNYFNHLIKKVIKR